MASITDKVKHVLHLDKDKSTTSSTTHSTTTTHGNNVPEGTAGPHTSRVANAADPRVDSDLDSSNRHTGAHGTGIGGTTHTGSHGTGIGGTTHNTTGHSATGAGYGSSTTTAGPHSSNLLNKADPTVDSDLSGGNHLGAQSDTRTAGYSGTGTTGAGYGSTGTHGTHTGAHTGTTGGFGSTGTSHSTNAGPHSSNLLNKADPRVDSDLDGSNRHTGTTGAGYGSTGTHTGAHTGTTGGFGTTSHSTTNSTNAGPHSSNLLNKADPRVDSDLDGSNRHTGTTGSGLTGHSTTGAGYGSTHTGTGHTSTAGPHSSNIANKADPRVDSDRSNTYGSSTTGAGAFSTPHAGTGTHGGISHSTNAGPHNSNTLNKADPRVDSDLSGAGGHIGHSHGGITGAHGSHATPGSGTAQNTAGPHNSDLLNKIDPRVDSDLNGSKTVGGNKTHQ